MKFLFVIGRIAFVLIFILSGVQKLFDISGTAAMIESKLVVPPILIDLEAKLHGLTDMPLPRLLAVVAGVVEIGGGLLIAVNFGTRIATATLIVFTAFATYLFHDFWAMVGAERSANMIQAMKNLSIMGGLIILFVLGTWRPEAMGYRDRESDSRY
jgi:putative oxidoreductase